jgi:CheY-like chemotaxis protein/anti-sigma regulatory factor (Ser/Thr protein kinase)
MPDAGFVISFADVTAERAAIAALSRANETLEARVAERTLKLAEALADAERANASRSRFVAAASHDLLQPLSAAKLFIASIGDKALDPGARGALSKAQNALDSVAGILGALLDISKLESGRAAVSVGPVALNRLLDPLRDEFTAIAAAKGLRLTVVACGAVVASDAAYLRRVLQNLIGNAVRYTDRGRVLVGARRLPGAVRIEVRDTGPGIAPADQQAIWREFHRLNAPASASEGMGLGLAIVERACGLLDHPLSLTSAPGQGACFAVTVPLAEQPAPQPPRNPVAPGALGDLIVMLVENDDGMRRALEHLLESWGAQVLQAASGDEALDLIDELGILPDALIVDQRLDTGTGTGFVEGLRARHGPLPALLVTADRSPATSARAAALDLAVLAKPVDTQRLHLWLAETAKGAPLTTKV